jgi:hypothetical protein
LARPNNEMSRWAKAERLRTRYVWPAPLLGQGTGGSLRRGGRGTSFVRRASPVPCFKELETIHFLSPARRFTSLRVAMFLINGLAALVAVGFLADGVPPVAHELRSKRDAQAAVAIEAFVASLTPNEKARLYRVLTSTESNFASFQARNAEDDAVLEKFRIFWEPFQGLRAQIELWGRALRSVSSSTKAGEVLVAVILLAVVATSALALRAHGRQPTDPTEGRPWRS